MNVFVDPSMEPSDQPGTPPEQSGAPRAASPVREGVGQEAAAPAADAQAPVAQDGAEPGAADGAAPAGEASSEPAADGERRGRNRRRSGRGKRGEDGAGATAEGDGEGAAQAAGGQGERPPREPREPRPPRAPRPEVGQRSTELFSEVLSGQFDTETAEPEAGTGAEEEGEENGKRVLSPEPEAPKLHKVLAQAGIGSRRDMEQLIQEGRVSVNGEPAHIGMRISFGDQIRVAGKQIKVRISPPPARVLAYHKPVGEVVTHDDPQDRPTVFRRLPKLHQGKWQSVGRLDLNTEGLLLFTNSGELANQLMHPRFGVEREYAVRVLGTLEQEARERLLEGVQVEGQAASFKSIEDGGGEGVNRWYRVVITEGRNREVRKLFDAVGLTVNRLIRIRYGSVVLPRGLQRGVWVEMDERDVRAIRSLAGGDRAGGNQQQGKGGKPQGQGQGQGKGGNKQQGKKGGQGQQQARGNKQGGGNQQGNRPQGGRPQGRDRYDERPNDRAGERLHDAPDGDDDRDDGPMHIPNPLEQTFDRRFATGSKRISRGFGRPASDDAPPQGGNKGGPRQPDPMQTSVGYIGADAYFNKVRGPGGGRGGKGGGGGGGGRGYGGGGGNAGGGRKGGR